MTVRFLLSAFLLATLISCSKEPKDVPPLSRDQMVELMMNIYLAEARTSVLPIAKDSAYRLFVPYQDSLMRRRAISYTTLEKAYSYYLQHPTEFEAIYDAIIDSLSLREQRLREAPAPQQQGK